MIRGRRLLTSVRRPAVRVLAVVSWIGLVLVLTLAPGDSALVEETSVALGGKDYTDANGHIVLFCILIVLCFWALKLRFIPRKALAISVSVCLLIGTGTELAQILIPHRGAAWLDIGANWIGVLAAAMPIMLAIVWTDRPSRKDSPSHHGMV